MPPKRSLQRPRNPAANDGELLVECPRCERMAVVTEFKRDDWHYVRLVCTHCGNAQEKRSQFPSDVGVKKVWLEIPCCGHELVARNARHLTELEEFVGASLRERRQDEWGWSNKHWRSRIPRWISSAQNREQVLHCIEKLKRKLLEG